MRKLLIFIAFSAPLLMFISCGGGDDNESSSNQDVSDWSGNWYVSYGVDIAEYQSNDNLVQKAYKNNTLETGLTRYVLTKTPADNYDVKIYTYFSDPEYIAIQKQEGRTFDGNWNTWQSKWIVKGDSIYTQDTTGSTMRWMKIESLSQNQIQLSREVYTDYDPNTGIVGSNKITKTYWTLTRY